MMLTETEQSLLPTEAGSANMTSLKSQVFQSLRTSEEYRVSFVQEKVSSMLAAQIKAIREQRGMDTKRFAEKLGKKVSWIYRLEDPNSPPPTISSLLEVASAFDVDLEVRFRPFSALLNDLDHLSAESLQTPGFQEEFGGIEQIDKDMPRDSSINSSNQFFSKSLDRQVMAPSRSSPVVEMEIPYLRVSENQSFRGLFWQEHANE